MHLLPRPSLPHTLEAIHFLPVSADELVTTFLMELSLIFLLQISIFGTSYNASMSCIKLNHLYSSKLRMMSMTATYHQKQLTSPSPPAVDPYPSYAGVSCSKS